MTSIHPGGTHPGGTHAGGTGPGEGESRAWGWVASLAEGGTTPWHDWSGAAEPSRRALPGAQQLELVRRLNRVGGPGPRLLERILTTSAAGRGHPDLDLLGAFPGARWGPPPVDPAQLPASELLAVATTLLAEDLLAAGTPAPAPVARPRPWRRAYRLVGPAWLADPLREDLRRRGHPPGRRRATVLVVGTDLATMVGHAYTARAFGDGVPPWPQWLARQLTPQRIPRPADLAATAAAWTARVGRNRVRVVLEPERVPRMLGLGSPAPVPAPLAAEAVELARHVGFPLGLLVPPDRRRELLRGVLLPRVAAHPGSPLRLPPAKLEMARRQARRLGDTLLAQGYPVIGGPERLLPPVTAPGESRGRLKPRAGPDDDRVLDLALGLLLGRRDQAAARSDGHPEPAGRG